MWVRWQLTVAAVGEGGARRDAHQHVAALSFLEQPLGCWHTCAPVQHCRRTQGGMSALARALQHEHGTQQRRSGLALPGAHSG